MKLILINVDSGEVAKEKAVKFLQAINVSHEFLLDRYQIALKKYNPAQSVPATFLINDKGYIIFKEIGAKFKLISELEKRIQKLRK